MMHTPDEPRGIDAGGEELSDAERRAFAMLPRELDPPAGLEDRAVYLLRQRGHLPTPLESVRRSEPVRRPSWWVTIAAAAAIAVFFSGMAVGQYIGMHNAVSIATASARTATEATDRVRRTGDLYVAALASLSRLSDTTNAAERENARKAAMAALGAAAEQMAHLAPDDPLAAAVLRGLNQRNREPGSEAPSSRSVIWY
jgi:hypothetical protein